jgi:hypothetical protein
MAHSMIADQRPTDLISPEEPCRGFVQKLPADAEKVAHVP